MRVDTRGSVSLAYNFCACGRMSFECIPWPNVTSANIGMGERRRCAVTWAERTGMCSDIPLVLNEEMV